MKYLFFNPENFRFDPKVTSSVGKITTVEGFDGEEVSAWQFSDWNWNWSTIRTEMELEPNSEYNYCFWLNGGENDRCDEILNIEIWFGSDFENRITTKLNRDFFMPTLVKNGWYLFCVPFKTGDDGYTTIRFNCMGAYVTVAPSKSPVEYEHIVGDTVENAMPQRPNIVFEEGYPDEQKKEAITVKVFGRTVKTTPSQVKKTLGMLGTILAAFLVIRRVFRKKKNK